MSAADIASDGFLCRERERSRRRPDEVERCRAWLAGHEAACAASEAVDWDCVWLCHVADPCFHFAGPAQSCAAPAGGVAAKPHDQAQPQDAPW